MPNDLVSLSNNESFPGFSVTAGASLCSTCGFPFRYNEVVVPKGTTRLYPEGMLAQKLDALRTYSRGVWKNVGGHY